MQVYLHKIGARLLGKLTICTDNAGPLRGQEMWPSEVEILNTDATTNCVNLSTYESYLMEGY